MQLQMLYLLLCHMLFVLGCIRQDKRYLVLYFIQMGSYAYQGTLLQKLRLFNIPEYYPEHTIVSRI